MLTDLRLCEVEGPGTNSSAIESIRTLLMRDEPDEVWEKTIASVPVTRTKRMRHPQKQFASVFVTCVQVAYG